MTAAGAGEDVETEAGAGEGELEDPLVAAVTLGCPAATVDTRLRAAVMVGCRASFRLEAASREGAAVVAGGALPAQRGNSIAPLLKQPGLVNWTLL